VGGTVFRAGTCAFAEKWIETSGPAAKHTIATSARKHADSVRGKPDVVVDDRFIIINVRAGTGVIKRVGDEDVYALKV
jgi:hypothetical protein